MPVPAPDAALVVYRPPAIAELLGVAHDTVLGWIRSGELVASDLTAPGKRPRYVVRREHLDEFLDRRRPTPPPKRERRRRTAPAGEFKRY